MGDQAHVLGFGKASTPRSGRASPLISAGQVLDQFIALSNGPSRENSDIKQPKKLGLSDNYRQDIANTAVEMLCDGSRFNIEFCIDTCSQGVGHS